MIKEKNNKSNPSNVSDKQKDNEQLPKTFNVGKQLIKNFEQNLNLKNYRYNQLVYDFSMLMFLANAKSYEQLRQVFPTPSK